MIYAVCLLELVVLLLAMFLRWPALFTLALVFIAIWVVLYFVLAFAIAWALAGGNDACPGETAAWEWCQWAADGGE